MITGLILTFFLGYGARWYTEPTLKLEVDPSIMKSEIEICIEPSPSISCVGINYPRIIMTEEDFILDSAKMEARKIVIQQILDR